MTDHAAKVTHAALCVTDPLAAVRTGTLTDSEALDVVSHAYAAEGFATQARVHQQVREINALGDDRPALKACLLGTLASQLPEHMNQFHFKAAHTLMLSHTRSLMHPGADAQDLDSALFRMKELYRALPKVAFVADDQPPLPAVGRDEAIRKLANALAEQICKMPASSGRDELLASLDLVVPGASLVLSSTTESDSKNSGPIPLSSASSSRFSSSAPRPGGVG